MAKQHFMSLFVRNAVERFILWKKNFTGGARDVIYFWRKNQAVK
ncbi:MAG: hypothetical protein AAB706_02305 [Patescibacteria group bacterium]